MDKALTQYNTRIFAEKVMPRLKDRFSEWEDRWWPKPMQPAERAEQSGFTPKLAAE